LIVHVGCDPTFVPPRQLLGLRSRLWPTRRYFELRLGRLEEQLDAIRGSLQELAADRERTAGESERLLAGQAELRSRLRRNQGLTARTYEALQDWPSQLAQARQSERYARAYDEPEPLVSIPIPTYRSPDTLCERALASVRAQSYPHWEAIVVGDHCTDDTEARVLALGDPRIRFHNLAVRENDPEDPWERWAVKGSVPRATGIELAAGTWIAPLSHDDAWDADHLEILLGAARERRAEVAYSQARPVWLHDPQARSDWVYGAWPPRRGQLAWQSSIFNGALQFLRYDRACALASEPNDWNLTRRAWEAGVRFSFVERLTSTIYLRPREFEAELAALGLPPEAAASP
jgi:hypothetical protein